MNKSHSKTFPLGGIHPKDNKLSADKPIEKLSLPQTVSIPITQHIGKPATPVVNVGDKVKVGQLIAKGEGFITANIHSSVGEGFPDSITGKLDKNLETFQSLLRNFFVDSIFCSLHLKSYP